MQYMKEKGESINIDRPILGLVESIEQERKENYLVKQYEHILKAEISGTYISLDAICEELEKASRGFAEVPEK